MSMLRSRTACALVMLTVALVGCTGSPKHRVSPSPVHRGGVYRTAIEDFGFTDALDPTGEYRVDGTVLFGQLLVRSLVIYRYVVGLAGDQLVPDLATDTGEISIDGLSWTFHLKDGVRFGPPVNREITSADVEYAFRRIDTTSLVAQSIPVRTRSRCCSIRPA